MDCIVANDYRARLGARVIKQKRMVQSEQSLMPP